MKKLLCTLFAIMLLTNVLTFGKEVEAAESFRDVSSSFWAKDEIIFLSNKGVISGFSNGTFQPERTVTRGQAAIMLVRSLNLSLKNRPNPGFTDVATTNGSYKYIAAIVDEGIYPKGTKFNPEGALTRQEMARLLVNAYSLTGEKNVTYTDVPKSYWAHSYISILSENGIAAGYSNGYYKPTASVTRAQFAVFMSRSLDDRFKVQPPVSPVQKTPILMKDIKFGMTPQQVKALETNFLIEDFGDSSLRSLTYTTLKYGYETNLVYYFENNQLAMAVYDFLPWQEYLHTTYEMYVLQDLIHNEAVKELGNNFFYDEESYPYNNFTTFWDKNSYAVLLSVNDEDLYTSAKLIYGNPSVYTASVNKKNRASLLMEDLKELQSSIDQQKY